MISRSVQILYHLYAVARNTDQGVVGAVLTEYHMDEQHSADLAEARLRDVARQGMEMLSAERDILAGTPDALIETALDLQREACCRRVLALIKSLPYPPELITRAMQPMKMADPEWRSLAFATLAAGLTLPDRALLSPLFERSERRGQPDAAAERLRQERLVELGLGRYSWASPWLRACAWRCVDPAAPGAKAGLTRAAADPEALVAETAAAALSAMSGGGSDATTPSYSTIDKVLILRDVSLFKAIPHEVLASVAMLLTDRWAAPGERIFQKGDLGDCLYVIASGRVRVHDGDRTFKVLEARGFFGELSLLDTEPRSASVSAVEPAHLFRLGQADFYSLLSEQPTITHAINRALCQMVRSANASSSG